MGRRLSLLSTELKVEAESGNDRTRQLGLKQFHRCKIIDFLLSEI